MIESKVFDSERLRIIQYDCVLSGGLYERHTLEFIPRNSRGELCPMKMLFATLTGGLWTLMNMNSDKLGVFSKAGELTKWAKTRLKSEMAEQE